MKTVTYTITQKLYEYNELSGEAKETAKQKYLETKEAWEFEDIVKEDLNYLFPNSNLSVQFSLAYCQGDGLNIYGKLSKQDCLHIAKQFDFSEKEIKRLDFYLDYCNYELPENRGYCYCIADQFEIDLSDLESYYHFRNIDWNLIERFEDTVKNTFKRLCRQNEEEGYNFFYECSDEEIEEIASANEWLFDEYGFIN